MKRILAWMIRTLLLLTAPVYFACREIVGAINSIDHFAYGLLQAKPLRAHSYATPLSEADRPRLRSRLAR